MRHYYNPGKELIVKRLLCVITAALLAILLAACQTPLFYQPSSSLPASSTQAYSPQQDIGNVLGLMQGVPSAHEITADFLLWGCETIAEDFASTLYKAIQTEGYHDGLFFPLFGQTLHVLYAFYTGATETNPYIHTKANTTGPVMLAFTGDINLADDWEIMPVVNAQPGGVADCISGGLLERMQAADILLVNNEFSFSSRGAPMAGKQYTFRANPANAEILHALGVDIVSLANNHVFDYGEDAFLDTLTTLSGTAIPYVGAGKNIEEAMQAQYFIAGGMKIAYVAASRAEKYILTPEATETTPGVLRTYDPALFLQAVQVAKQNADVVIAYPHWGTENTHVLEKVQVELGEQLVDAGADIVVGAHPHCLQGISFYNGKPIAYSLGNFWFNTSTGDTALLEITIEAPGQYTTRVVPCLQRGGKTTMLTEEQDRSRVFTHLQTISTGITIGPDGTVAAV